MKKPTLIVIGIIFLAFISVYFIIPQKIVTNRVIEIDASDINVAKFLVYKKPWDKWWPGQHSTADSNLFSYQGTKYILQTNTNSKMDAAIKHSGIELNSSLTYASIGDGMCRVTWVTEIQTSLNPVTRVSEFIKIKSLTTNIDTILSVFKKFMQADTNVYGMAFKVSQVKHPIVLAFDINTNSYPSTEVIYALAEKLKKQINAEKATIVDSPMLNVHPNESKGYQVMVAIPIDKVITPGKNMVINKLVKDANLLETQVTGGKNTIDNAFVQLKNYQKNYRLISPAMPYELLITNRLVEKDTSKWVTKIFWPIF